MPRLSAVSTLDQRGICEVGRTTGSGGRRGVNFLETGEEFGVVGGRVGPSLLGSFIGSFSAVGLV